MTRLIVSERDGSEIADQETNLFDLPESRGTDVRLDMSRDDIESMVRRGDDLIIRLENGEVITLEDYFVATADELPHRLFTNEDAGFLPLGLAEGAAVAGAAGAAGGVSAGGVLGGLAAVALAGAGSGRSSAATPTDQNDLDDVDGDGDINDVLIGTENADELNGFGGDDIISGLEGDDVLIGGAGNDSIDGGANNDDISGDAGNDTLNGNEGEDTISGGDDDDVIDGGLNNDVLSGNDGDDAITGDNGNDVIDGGDGNDTLAGNNGEDTISGGDGNDLIEGGASNDTLSGNDGNDTLFGSNGADTINGGAGDDDANGGSEDDLIIGGAGDDTLDGNAGNDTIEGGADDDVINGGADDDIISGGTGDDDLMGEGGRDTFIVEDNPGNDTIIGGEDGDDYDVIDLSNVTGPVEVVFDEDDSEAGTITIGDDVIQFEEIEEVLTNAVNDPVPTIIVAPVIDPTDGTVVTGTGVPGAIVTLTDTDGAVIGTAEVGHDETWTVVPETTVEDGTVLEATQAFEGGDDSPLSNQVTPNDTDADLVSDSIDIDDDGDGITDLTEEGLFVEDFGNGETINVAELDPLVSTDFNFDNNGGVEDNRYAIKANEELSAWNRLGDNSDDADGRFLVVNAGDIVGDTYARNLDVDPNATLQIQFDARNLLNGPTAALASTADPNLTFEVRDLDGNVLGSYDTGDVPGDQSWHTYSFEIDPQGNDTVELAIVSNLAETSGNDIGIDNIIVDQAGADQDGDGVANSLDLDSDGDGAADIDEAQNGEPFIAPSNVDADGNGLDDAFESTPGAGEGLTPVDTNDDARPDYLDDQDGGAPVLDFGLLEAQAPADMDSNDVAEDDVLEALAVEMAVLNATPETIDLGDEAEGSAAASAPAASTGGSSMTDFGVITMISAADDDIETVI